MYEPNEIEFRIERAKMQAAQSNAERRVKHVKEQKRAEHYNAMSPGELAQDLHERCDIEGLDSLTDLEDRLLKQALTLDTSFSASMHDAGLGYKTALDMEAFKMALNAQKLCRQTFDTLKSAEDEVKIQKPTIGTQKDET